jgi:hypothetical protein
MKFFDLGDGVSARPVFIPNNLSPDHASRMFLNVPSQVKVAGKNALDAGWRFFAVRQSRGRCYYSEKVITIPAWVIDSPRAGYKAYYIAHEIAHIHAPGDSHGAKFMAAFRSTCPIEFQHYELEYKPRNAASAGIMKDIGMYDSNTPMIDF